MPRYRRGFDVDEAFAHLARRDRKLGAWMRRLGPIPADPRWRKSFDPVDALARAILFQQLSGKAASTIVDLTGPAPRVVRDGPVSAEQIAQVLGLDPAELAGER